MSREPSIPELDLSDDEQHFTEISNRKRSSRGEYYYCSTLLPLSFSKFRLACDQCRKTKSKCERFKGDDEPCKSCSAAGTGTEHFPICITSAERICISLHILGFVPLLCPCFLIVTFARTGPSFKRGPPKGYIHAIEQRWHQVESVLGAILTSTDPDVQALINNLRKDDLARDILGRVESGPFVRISKPSLVQSDSPGTGFHGSSQPLRHDKRRLLCIHNE